MALTQEEIARIKAQLDAGKPLTELEELKPIVDLGVTVLRTDAQDVELRTAYADRQIQERFKETDARAYGNFEKSIKEATGVEKKPNEATTDYFARAYREKVDAEVAAAKNLTGEASEESKKLITALQDQLATMKQTHDKQIATIEKQAYNTRLNAALEREKLKALAQVETSLEGEILEAVLDKKMAGFMKANKLKLGDDDELIALDDKGLPVQNPTTFKPEPVSALLANEFKTLPPKVKADAAKGAGGGQQQQQGKRSADGKFIPPADGFKTRVQLTTALMEAGFADGTPEFTENFNTHAEGLPLR